MEMASATTLLAASFYEKEILVVILNHGHPSRSIDLPMIQRLIMVKINLLQMVTSWIEIFGSVKTKEIIGN